MLIGIEAERANNRTKTGVEHYAKQLILHLAEIDSVNQYTLILRSKPEDWFFKLPKNFKVKVIPFPIFWTQLRISWEMLFHPVDVLMIPASALPLIHPRRSVVTIHDVAWRYFPDSFTWFMRNFLEWSTKFAVKNASKIIAVSESTKKDLVKFYKVDAAKITVVYHGYEITTPSRPRRDTPPFLKGGEAPQVTPGAPQAPRNSPGALLLPKEGGVPHAVGGGGWQPYILFLSTLQPRKNLSGLLEAFSDLKKENPDIPHKLVVVGKPGWKYQQILVDIDRYKHIVEYKGHVSDEERFKILSHADLLVLPSFYEGFGMQILEAFETNVPVATSNASSMPEVAGEAAVYFDPRIKNEIKNAIKNILLDKSLADRLRQKGKERLGEFSWKKCAGETLKALQSK